jgi:hypothetical protein
MDESTLALSTRAGQGPEAERFGSARECAECREFLLAAHKILDPRYVETDIAESVWHLQKLRQDKELNEDAADDTDGGSPEDYQEQ